MSLITSDLDLQLSCTIHSTCMTAHYSHRYNVSKFSQKQHNWSCCKRTDRLIVSVCVTCVLVEVSRVRLKIQLARQQHTTFQASLKTVLSTFRVAFGHSKTLELSEMSILENDVESVNDTCTSKIQKVRHQSEPSRRKRVKESPAVTQQL